MINNTIKKLSLGVSMMLATISVATADCERLKPGDQGASVPTDTKWQIRGGRGKPPDVTSVMMSACGNGVPAIWIAALAHGPDQYWPWP